MLTPYDFDIARRDTALPGLPILLDPEAFTEAIRRAAPSADAARPLYVRYKPGMNALFAFDLDVAGETVTLHAKAHRPADQVKFDKAARRPSVPGPLGPGRLVLADEGIIVSVFPNDAKLKSLERLGDPERRRRLLARLFPDAPTCGTQASNVFGTSPNADTWRACVRAACLRRP